ncbi:MAG: glutamate--tRNA ligase, partial [Lysobacteraceae bacterium]
RARGWYLGIEQWDQAAVSKHLLPAGAVLADARARLAALDEWNPEAIDAALRACAEAQGLGLGKVAQPLRVAMTGSQVSPSIDWTIHLCGREGALARLDRALDIVASGMLPG